jgi:hypothetical protein
MSASASINPNTNRMAVIAAGSEHVSTRETFEIVRDIAVVLGLQVVFRTMMFLRKLNY